VNLANHKKLTVFYKMEPGCLGPDGISLIEDYCSFAQRNIEQFDYSFVNWVIEPRYDKSLPEIQYKINGRELLPDMVERYLAVFDRNLDEFEDSFNEKLTELIEHFLRESKLDDG